MGTAHPLAMYLFDRKPSLGVHDTVPIRVLLLGRALEEGWEATDFTTNRIVALIGTTFGGVVILGLMTAAAVYPFPGHKSVNAFATLVLPFKDNLGEIGIIVFLIGAFAVCTGAGLEAAMSGSYAVMQYFGWDWGKRGRPGTAPIFHFGVMVLLVVAMLIAETQVNPIQMTTLAMAVAAVSLPFNFMIVANDRDFMGIQTNNLATNMVAFLLIGLLCAVTLAAVPLIFLSGSLGYEARFPLG